MKLLFPLLAACLLFPALAWGDESDIRTSQQCREDYDDCTAHSVNSMDESIHDSFECIKEFMECDSENLERLKKELRDLRREFSNNKKIEVQP